MPSGYCKKPELVKYLSLCRDTISKLMKEGLPHYRVGAAVLFKYDEVDEWMKQYRVDESDKERLDKIVDELVEGLQ